MTALMESSNATASTSSNVFKVENWKRDGELDHYETASAAQGFTVVSEIDGVTTDFDCTSLCAWWDSDCRRNCDDDDLARWDDFRKLFEGTAGNVSDFAVFRAMTHGSTTGIQSSENHYSTYFTDTNLEGSAGTIQPHLSGFRPFHIYDACLVGLTDANADSFMSAWAPLGTRGALASTAVTWTPPISDFNDGFYDAALTAAVGPALNQALTSYNPGGSCSGYCPVTKFEMNLFGWPWARCTPPGPSRSGDVAATIRVSRDPTQQVEDNLYELTVDIDADGHSIVDAGDGFQLVVINDFGLVQVEDAGSTGHSRAYPRCRPSGGCRSGGRRGECDVSRSTWPTQPAGLPATRSSPFSGRARGLVRSAGCGVRGSVRRNGAASRGNERRQDARRADQVLPVSFDRLTREAALHGAFEVIIRFRSALTGFVVGGGPEKHEFSVGEQINVITEIQNASAETNVFTVISVVIDSHDAPVSSIEEVVSVNPGETTAITNTHDGLPLPGVYGLDVDVEDTQRVSGGMTMLSGSEISRSSALSVLTGSGTETTGPSLRQLRTTEPPPWMAC